MKGLLRGSEEVTPTYLANQKVGGLQPDHILHSLSHLLYQMLSGFQGLPVITVNIRQLAPQPFKYTMADQGLQFKDMAS